MPNYYRVAVTVSVRVEAEGRYQAERAARERVQELMKGATDLWPAAIAYPEPISPDSDPR